MSNTKHYTKGSKKPSFEDDGHLRLYTTRFCPWAGRVCLALEAKNVPYHTINVHLGSKPEWFLELNPLGKVPCLQLVDKPGSPAFSESLLLVEYLDEVYPDPKLYPTDPLEKLQEKLWIERFAPIANKTRQSFWLTDTAANLDIWNEIQELLDVFEAELTRRGTTYFGGDRQANIVDYGIWPWFQRMEIAEELFGKGCEFNGKRFPALLKWLHNLNETDKGCRKLRVPQDSYIKYAKSIRQTGAPDFDIMVPQPK